MGDVDKASSYFKQFDDECSNRDNVMTARIAISQWVRLHKAFVTGEENTVFTNIFYLKFSFIPSSNIQLNTLTLV